MAILEKNFDHPKINLNNLNKNLSPLKIKFDLSKFLVSWRLNQIIVIFFYIPKKKKLIWVVDYPIKKKFDYPKKNLNNLNKNLSLLKMKFDLSKFLVPWRMKIEPKYCDKCYVYNWMFKMCVKHSWTFRPPIYKLPIQAYQQIMYVQKM